MTKNHIESIVAVTDETGNFVCDFRHAPICVTMMCEEMKDEIKKVLENMPLEQKLVTFEDTLFGFSPFYATGFSYQHLLLERRVMSTTQLFKEPVITLGYEVHDRKYKDDHKMFLYQLQKAINDKYTRHTLHSFRNKKMISVVDGEFQLKDDLWSLAKPNLDTVDITSEAI